MRPTILLTRPQHASERFAAQLRNRVGEVDVVISPVLRIRPLIQRVEVGEARALILTSANAVPFGVAGMQAYCVGDATARAASAAGMDPISAGGDATALIRRILADRQTGPLLHIRGAHSRGEIAQTLTQAGCPTREVIAYDQVAQSLSDAAKSLLSGSLPAIVPVFSPRSAEILSRLGTVGPGVLGAALSVAVAQKIENIPPERIRIAAAPHAQAMLDVIEGLMDASS
jgi:uroporphyrinogen-III synthase